MASLALQTAQKLRDALNSASWSLSFTATAEIYPEISVDQVGAVNPTVIVSPARLEAAERVTRKEVENRYEIVVTIMRRTKGEAEADEIIELAEEILDYFIKNKNLDGDFSVVYGGTLDPLIRREDARDKRLDIATVHFTCGALT